MFDAIAHGLPFVASDLEFFREFSLMGLGLAVKRNDKSFTQALTDLDTNYESYLKNVNAFKSNIRWDSIARKHVEIYEGIIKNTITQVKNESQSSSI